MYLGTGSTHAPLCSPSLDFPACASFCGNQRYICHCHPCLRPSASSPLAFSHPFILFSIISLLFCSTSSMNNNGGNICQGHGRVFICVETTWCFRKSDYQLFAELESVKLTGVMHVTVMRMCVILQLRWRFSHIVSKWDWWWEIHLHWVYVSVGIPPCVTCCNPHVSLAWEFHLTSAKHLTLWDLVNTNNFGFQSSVHQTNICVVCF